MLRTNRLWPSPLMRRLLGRTLVGGSITLCMLGIPALGFVPGPLTGARLDDRRHILSQKQPCWQPRLWAEAGEGRAVTTASAGFLQLGSRSLGLDWGHKKIGIAVSAGFSQRPLGTIRNEGGISPRAVDHRPTLDRIINTLRLESAERIVLGMPLYRDGTLSPQAQLVRFFAKFLANRAVELGVLQDRDEPFVYLWDERLTSQAARVAIKTKSYSHSSDDVDSQAACLMLEDFYQQRGKEAEVILPDEDVEVIALPAPTEPEEEAPPGLSMTYKEWKMAELQRFMPAGIEGLPKPSEADGTKRKKKKKKKR